MGGVEVAARRGEVWSALLDGDCDRAELFFGVGRVRGRCGVGLRLSNVVPPQALDLAGQSLGLLGGGKAVALS